MRKLFFYSHDNKSGGVKALCKELGAIRVRHENSRFRGRPEKTVINWGASELPAEVGKCRIINTPKAVALCSNKRSFFDHVKKHCNIPEFTDDRDTAKKWAADKNTIVFCRTLLRGSGGRGIIQAELPEEVVDASLYTKYIPKREEYRVHVANGEPFLIQRKALREGVSREAADWRVRNLHGGFIFARNEGHIPHDEVITQAVKAFNAVDGLTFGSVDVIFNEHRDEAYVLEINTASGLSGSTVEDYTKMLSKVV